MLMVLAQYFRGASEVVPMENFLLCDVHVCSERYGSWFMYVCVSVIHSVRPYVLVIILQVLVQTMCWMMTMPL